MKMKPSLRTKLNKLSERHQKIADQLADPTIIRDQNRFRDLSREFSELDPIVEHYRQYQEAESSKEAAEKMLEEEGDLELKAMAQEEIHATQATLEEESLALQVLLLPVDKNDSRNVFLEIRAGTGGNEAAIFAGDLLRMYLRFSEQKGWQTEVIIHQPGEQGGCKESILKISGEDVYADLKFESGVHRVQRVPATESQGRVHTSACTVAILPEAEQVDEIEINPADLKIDTFRASGAGGQHVNKTESAIRVTHIPSGTVVECQDERSQHKNRAKALSFLQARLLAEERRKQKQQEAQTRRDLVGSGDRSERIRTYNYPQGRVTDHRINLTLYKLLEIMEGDLFELVKQLRQEHQADLLSVMSSDEN
jgi:peptide chain release factor 1